MLLLNCWSVERLCILILSCCNSCFALSLQLQSAKVGLDGPDNFERGVNVQLEREVWSKAGCSEFFQRLNFTAMGGDPKSPSVMLTAPAAKLDRRTLHFAATAVVAAFSECHSAAACIYV